jgi:hypothetical protein
VPEELGAVVLVLGELFARRTSLGRFGQISHSVMAAAGEAAVSFSIQEREAKLTPVREVASAKRRGALCWSAINPDRYDS